MRATGPGGCPLSTLVAILGAAGRAPGPAPQSGALDEDPRTPGSARLPGPRRRRDAPGFDRSKDDPKDLIGFFRKDQRLNKLVEEKKYAEARALATTCSGSGRGSPTATSRCPRSPPRRGASTPPGRRRPRRSRWDRRTTGPISSSRALLRARGDLDGAIAHFRQALALDPSAPDTRTWLGRALAEKGQLDEAAGLLGPGAGGPPESAMAATQLGYVLAKQGKRAEAIASYRRPVALDPGSAEAHAYLGSALAQKEPSGTKPSRTSRPR